MSVLFEMPGEPVPDFVGNPADNWPGNKALRGGSPKPFSPSDIESAVTEFVKTSTAAGAVNGTAKSVGE